MKKNLFLATAERMSRDQMDQLREVIEPQLPRGSVLVIVPAGVMLTQSEIEVPDRESRRSVLFAAVNTVGVGGRDVQHVNTPDAVQPAGLPRSVWVPTADIELGQSQFASAQDESNGFLMQEDFLTPAQRAKYLPEVQS